MSMKIVPSVSVADFEAILESLPDPASHATFLLNGYFDIQDINRQVGKIVPGLDLYPQEGLKLMMGKPSKEILKAVYRHEVEEERRGVEGEPKPRIQIGGIIWYLKGSDESRPTGQILVRPYVVRAAYGGKEPEAISGLRKVIEPRGNRIPFHLSVGNTYCDDED